jgi:hypothetical protein
MKLTKAEKAQARKNKARHEAFIREYKALCRKYGLGLVQGCPQRIGGVMMEPLYPDSCGPSWLENHLNEVTLPLKDEATLVDWLHQS